MRTRSRRFGALVLAVLFGTVVALGQASTAQAFVTKHTWFQGEPNAMGQTNGPVLATKIAGNRIYVGGDFDAIRPAGAAPGTSETPVSNLAAFDATTGAPITGFAPALHDDWNKRPGVVRAMVVSPDGSTLYVGGDFNNINGQNSEHVAAFDAATGQYLREVGWNGVNGPVKSLAIDPTGTTLYVGGSFNQASWTSRNNLAAFDLTDNSPLPFAPAIATPVQNTVLGVEALGVSADGQTVFAGGPFRSANGVARQGFAAFNAADAANAPGFSSYFYAPNSYATSIDATADTVYVGGRDDLTGSLSRTEGVFAIDATSGAKKWFANCYGDTFAVKAVGDEVYVGSHSHDCSRNGGLGEAPGGRQYFAMHVLDKTTGKEIPYFVQTGNDGTAKTKWLSRALDANAEQLVMGGGFSNVNGKPQSHISRFLPGSAAPARAPWPSATSSCSGCASTKVKVLKTFDRDDVDLTYAVYRGWDTSAVPVAIDTSPSYIYPIGTFTITDNAVTVGQSVYYTVVVSDPAGNKVNSVRSNTVVVGQ